MATRLRRVGHTHRVLLELKAWFDAEPKEDERAKAIVGAAMLEGALTHVLRAALVPGKAVDRLLDPGPGGLSFAARIDVAFAAGIIARGAWDDLHRIRRVRNSFAHDLRVRSFRDPRVAGDCMKLVSARDDVSRSMPPASALVVFEETCLLLGYSLLKPTKALRPARNKYDNDVIRRERRRVRDAARRRLL